MMKVCTKCGQELVDEAVVCTSCGCAQDAGNNAVQAPADSSSFGWALLGFCIPIVGLILYLVWKDSTPLKAKSAGKGALVSVILSVVVYIIYFIIIGIAAVSLA